MSATTQLPAGRELDALIAEKVMGGVSRHPEWYWLRSGTAPEVPDLPTPKGRPAIFCGPGFSTDIAAAWNVVERLKARYRFELVHRGGDRPWVAVFGTWRATADTAPLAICRAALATVRIEP